MRSSKLIASPQVPAPRGRPFARGNPGRKAGSKNRSTLVAAALLRDQKAALLSTALQLALGGDVPMLKFLLGRILPRDRLITVDLPKIEFAEDAIEALGRTIDLVTKGQISPSEGAALASLINFQIRAIDLEDVVKRMDALELKLKEGGAV